MKNVLITGGTGLIGSKLADLLQKKGYQVALLSRKSNENARFKTFKWDIENLEIDKEALINIDAIIHLAGENVGEKRWTSTRKKQIIDSRIKSTAFLYKVLHETKHQVKIEVEFSQSGKI